MKVNNIKTKRNNEFDRFLHKEIITQKKYDKLYGEDAEHTEDKSEMDEKADEGIGSDNEDHGMLYEEAELDSRILRAVTELGFTYMTPIQEQAIPIFMSGKDVIGQAQTGTGKTAAFGIPILQKIDAANRNLQAVVLCPTRELAIQAADEIRKFAKYMHGIKVLPIYGGQDIVHQIKNLKGGVQIVVGTPGRVMDHMRRHTLKMETVHTVVLDEADEMLNMGFREDIETILKEMPEERQTGLFSATMPKPILEITHTYQKDAQFIKVTPKEVTIPLIKQAYYQVKKADKEEVLCRLIDYYDPKRALIFCNTKRMVDELTMNLKNRGYEVDGLHGDLSQHQRDMVMNLFRSGRVNILIATDVAARGIDVSDVEAVYNYDVPEDIEYYVHRIGRTGRAGKTGRSFTLVVGREVYKIRDIERICNTKIKERKIPGAADIMKKKADKYLSEIYEVIETQDITRATDFIIDVVSQGNYSSTQIAAAFLKMKLGEELEEIKEDRFFAERPRMNRRGGGRTENRQSDRRGGGRTENRRSDRRAGEGRDNHRTGDERNDRRRNNARTDNRANHERRTDRKFGDNKRNASRRIAEKKKPKDVRMDGRSF